MLLYRTGYEPNSHPRTKTPPGGIDPVAEARHALGHPFRHEFTTVDSCRGTQCTAQADVMGAALLPLGVEVTRTGVPNGTMLKLLARQ